LRLVLTNNYSWTKFFRAGVHPHLIKKTKGFDGMLKQAQELAKKNTIVHLEKNDSYVIAAGMPFVKQLNQYDFGGEGVGYLFWF